MAAIKSTDPRKPSVMKALKAKSGATKVTNVKEVRGIYSGDCWKFMGRGEQFEHLGKFECTAKEIGFEK